MFLQLVSAGRVFTFSLMLGRYMCFKNICFTCSRLVFFRHVFVLLVVIIVFVYVSVFSLSLSSTSLPLLLFSYILSFCQFLISKVLTFHYTSPSFHFTCHGLCLVSLRCVVSHKILVQPIVCLHQPCHFYYAKLVPILLIRFTHYSK